MEHPMENSAADSGGGGGKGFQGPAPKQSNIQVTAAEKQGSQQQHQDGVEEDRQSPKYLRPQRNLWVTAGEKQDSWITVQSSPGPRREAFRSLAEERDSKEHSSCPQEWPDLQQALGQQVAASDLHLLCKVQKDSSLPLVGPG